MDTFVNWVAASSLAAVINEYAWIWPLAETLHFIGLSLLIGIAGFFDLRLMGFFKRIPLVAAKQLMPFALGGFLVNLVTGMVFLIGQPAQYADNPAWWWKVGFLGLAGLNAVVFEATVSRRIVYLEPGIDTPVAAKLIGVVSLVSWFGVLYWGRMLPFLGNAF